MSGRAEFQITNRAAARAAITPHTRRVAQEIADSARAATPRDTGDLAGGWRIVRGSFPGVFIVVNDVPHGRYVELGTVRRHAVHMLGRAAAAARGRYTR